MIQILIFLKLLYDVHSSSGQIKEKTEAHTHTRAHAHAHTQNLVLLHTQLQWNIHNTIFYCIFFVIRKYGVTLYSNMDNYILVTVFCF